MSVLFRNANNMNEIYKNSGPIFVAFNALLWGGMAVMFPVMIPALLEVGATLPEAGLIVSLNSLVLLLLDIPAGSISDRMGRLKCVWLGFLMIALGLVFFGIMANLSASYCCFALMGVGRSLISGALDAWFIDSEDNKNRLDYFFQQKEKWIMIAMISGSIFGGALPYLLGYKYFSNFIVAAAIAFLPCIILLAKPHAVSAERLKPRDRPERRRIFYSWAEVRAMVHLLPYAVSYGLIFFTTEIFWVPILGFTEQESIKYPLFIGALAYASFYASSFILFHIVQKRFERLLTPSFGKLFWYRLSAGLIFTACAFFPDLPLGITLAIAAIYMLSFLEAPIYSRLLSDATFSSHRAGLLSIDSSVRQMANIAAGALVPWGLSISKPATLAFIGLLVVASCLLSYLLRGVARVAPLTEG